MPYYINPFTGELDLTVASLSGNVIKHIDADIGSAVPVSDNINIYGDAVQGMHTSAIADTITITVDDASEIQKGVSELATDAESIDGIDSTKTIVPTSLKAKLGVQTNQGIPYGTGDTNALSWTNALTDGQIVIGSTLGTPQAANLTSIGGTIAITDGPGTINLEAGLSVPITVVAENGSTCTPVAGHLHIVGTATNGINTTAAGDTLTIGMSTPFAGDFTFENNVAATPRFISVENNDTDPGSYACVAVSAEPGGGDPYIFFEVDSATRYYSLGVDNSIAGDPLKLTNNVNPSTGDALISTTSAGVITLFNDLDVTEGGTGVSTLTSHGVLLGNGAGDIQATAEPTNGQILVGKTGDFPQLSQLQPGPGIAITSGAGSITVSAWGGGVSWTVETVNLNFTVNKGIIANKAGLLTVTLPATAAIGDILEITGINTAVGWRIAQNANQRIHLGSTSSTIGVGGYIESTAIRDSVKLVCVVAGASTEYNALSSFGNITVV